MADKILVTAALVALVELKVASLDSGRHRFKEFIVTGLRMLAAAEGEVIAASKGGKAKTVSQIIAIFYDVRDFRGHSHDVDHLILTFGLGWTT